MYHIQRRNFKRGYLISLPKQKCFLEDQHFQDVRGKILIITTEKNKGKFLHQDEIIEVLVDDFADKQNPDFKSVTVEKRVRIQESMIRHFGPAISILRGTLQL